MKARAVPGLTKTVRLRQRLESAAEFILYGARWKIRDERRRSAERIAQGAVLNCMDRIEDMLGHGGFGIVNRTRRRVLGEVAINE